MERIKEIIADNDLQQALTLVNAVFSEFVAVDYSEQGKITFENYLAVKYDEFSADLKSGKKRAWGYYEDEAVIGVSALRDASHIALMFVDKRYHRKGIARALFQHLLAEVRQNSAATKITVNASPYAEPIYARLGFIKTAERQEKDGIVFIPMEYSIDKQA